MQILPVNTYSINNSFKGWNEQKLNILGRNEKEMKELGFDFQNASYETIYDASRIHNIFGIEKHSKTIQAFCKLLKAVEETKEERRDYRAEIKTLELIAKIRGKLTKKAAKKIAELNNILGNMESSDSYKYYIEDDEPADTPEYKSEAELYREQTDWLVRL